MSDEQQAKLSERDEIEALLPWYVSGKLDAESRDRVARYMEAHPDLHAHLALAREESKAMVAANQSISPPGPQALERLRSSIATAPRRQRSSSMLEQISERFTEWMASLAPPQLALAGALAAFLVVAQAVAIGALVLERSGTPTYQTAGGEQGANQGSELLVGFSETATIGEISVLLKKIDAVVADGPRSGVYRLRLLDTKEETSKAAIEALQQSGIVTVVLPQE